LKSYKQNTEQNTVISLHKKEKDEQNNRKTHKRHKNHFPDLFIQSIFAVGLRADCKTVSQISTHLNGTQLIGDF